MPRTGHEMPFAASFCHTGPERLGTRVPGLVRSVDSEIDLTCFEDIVYSAKGVPGGPVNDPAEKSPEVAVMATFSNAFTAKWQCLQVIQSLVS
jgi:hypothetical protein